MSDSYLQNGPTKRQTGEVFDVACKVMLLGDSGVGKTCLLVRFKDGAFLSGSFISTVGIDYKNKVVEVDGSKVKLQIWDTAGQERFRSITHAYYRDSHALLLLYDVTNHASFENIRAWLAEIYEYARQDVIIMLLANKADLTKQRVVSRDQGEKLAKRSWKQAPRRDLTLIWHLWRSHGISNTERQTAQPLTHNSTSDNMSNRNVKDPDVAHSKSLATNVTK
ncbi:ras-related protein Rab-26 isoform X1 [Nematostella vectensis]|uniref:ras-related protein Rab-26 isoform X1 n=1 Tax=Nematostella vectensis TaxID=45351 RepID=UPI0013906C63|nr:ras-related protein Rab-26 isoform X1 [Nematostella vectensis]